MGVVYRAQDTLLERVVALKIIGANIEGNPELRERFFREARAAGQLSHRNIITIHDLGEHEGQPYLAMEFLAGEDLQRRLSRPEPMSLTRKLEIASEVCEGLAYAHRRGVVHRDIKPANIFITDEGVVKLLDFGLARMVTSELTASNMMLGTLNYMAPEQVRGERTDPRADIFSFGVVLYEILSGRKAFQGDSFATTLYKILQDVPEPLNNIDATLPVEVVRLVEKAIAKDRAERYQDLTELARDLALYRQHLTMGDAETMAMPASTTHRMPSDPPRSVYRRPDSGQRPTSNPAFDPSAPTMLTPVPEVSSVQSAAPAATPRSRMPLVAGVAALIVIVAGTAWYAWRVSQSDSAPSSVQTTASKPEPPAPPASGPGSVAAPPPALPPPPAGPNVPPTSPAAVNEARARMVRAKAAARDAGRVALRSPSYAAGVAAERDGVKLQQSGNNAEAAAKFYEAAGLFRSAELAAASQAAGEPTRVESRPPTPSPPPTSSLPPPATPPATTSPSKPTSEAPATEATPRPAESPAPVPPALVPGPAPLPPATRPTAPSTSTSTPAESPGSPEDGVRDLLKRYEQALEARSIDALKRAWPSLQGPQEDAIRKEFMYARRIVVDIESPAIDVAGNTATATFIRRYQISTVDGQNPVINSRTILSARRSGNDWVIERVRFEALR